MGGDNAPGEIVARRPRAPSRSSTSPSSSSARRRSSRDSGFPLIVATEVIAMDDDRAQGVRRKKDSSLVRAAEAVRDGKASAMVCAGNTGATMASALLRMGRIKGCHAPGDRHAHPGAWRDAHGPARRRRQRRVPARVARAVRPDGHGVRPPPLRHREAARRPAVDRRGGRRRATRCVKETHHAARAALPASTSSATSRAATS